MKVNPALKRHLVDVNSLHEDPANVRAHGDRNMEAIAASLEQFGQQKPIVVNSKGKVIAGNATLRAARDLGWVKVAAITFDGDGATLQTAYAIADNRTAELADWDDMALGSMLLSLQEDGIDVNTLLSFTEDEVNSLLVEPEPIVGPTLAEQFLVPPFTVLDARQGYWVDRKREWLALGVRPEVARQGGVFEGLTDYVSGYASPISIFDPVLCELVYRWFSPPGAKVLDPFTGSSVSGIVAAALGRHFVGVDLSGQQVAANIDQWLEVQPRLPDDKTGSAKWVVGDSRKKLPKTKVDLIFTDPPYYDLEQYSEDKADLSNAPTYQRFLDGYENIMVQACAHLKANRFICITVAPIRDGKGYYRDLVGDTVRLMQAAGTQYYNEAVLVTLIGSLPVRTRRAFVGSRKLGRSHQSVLLFVKGDPKQAAAAFGQVEVGQLETVEGEGL